MSEILKLSEIQNRIYPVRDKQVMLDSDLAELYTVETRALNQAVKRNGERFPDDFMFQLTAEEFANLISQSVISEKQSLISQSVIKVMAKLKSEGLL